MITQIRIDGFKSFVDFKLNVHPRTLLFGVNGAGKSNLFDALRLVEGTVRQGLDATIAGDRRFAARGLFHRGEARGGDGPSGHVVVPRFSITVGVLVATAEGPLPLRIGLRVEYEEGSRGRPGRARLLSKDSAVWVSSLKNPDWLHDLGLPSDLRRDVAAARKAFLAATGIEYLPIGDSRYGRNLAAHGEEADGPDAPVEVLEVEQPPHILFRGTAELHRLAAQECASWRPLTLDPSAMRDLVPAESEGPLRFDGGNLALVLDRIQRDAPESFTRLVADIAALVPGVRGLRTEFLDRRQEFDFSVDFSRTGLTAPASLSDGTLRAVALLAAYWDPEGQGLLPVEEIENGMHLGQVAELVRRLGRGADWPREAPYRQLLATTHSPALLAAWRSDVSGSVVFLEQADRVDPVIGTVSRITSARPLLPRDPDRDPGEAMSPQAVARMLQRLDLGVL
jgi:predicted ATPase